MSRISSLLPRSCHFTQNTLASLKTGRTRWDLKTIKTDSGNVSIFFSQEICSVAFEPNPKHAEHLLGLAESYATCGIKVPGTRTYSSSANIILMLMIVMVMMNILLCKVLVFNNTGVGHKDTTSSFAPFNTLLGHEVDKILPKTNLQEEQGLRISRKDEISPKKIFTNEKCQYVMITTITGWPRRVRTSDPWWRVSWRCL